jgi:hypothetical protein
MIPLERWNVEREGHFLVRRECVSIFSELLFALWNTEEMNV